MFDQNEAKAASACIIKFVVQCGEEGKAVPKKKQILISKAKRKADFRQARERYQHTFLHIHSYMSQWFKNW
jgi:hypothetical protein